MPKIKGLVIGAPFSGAGKTLLSCALIKAFREQGFTVSPFKVGPDYIDPGYLTRAAGRPCYNLDPWMVSEAGVKRSFARGARGGEIAVVEGVMGLFDGACGQEGSTAQVAKLLKLPVLLVFPAQKVAGTISALVKGLFEFDPGLEFMGVVLTKVASLRHEKMLLSALEKTGVPVLGVIPRKDEFKLPERHLGLVLAEEVDFEAIDLSSYLDLDQILDRLGKIIFEDLSCPENHPRVTVAVARDEAFSFYYQENLDLLEEAGARLCFFSPLRDPFPKEAQALYLGGGYPELYARKLSAREGLLKTMREKIKSGMPVLAECGGFMFLQKEIKIEGKNYPMLGVLDGVAELSPGLKALGYRTIKTLTKSPLGPEGLLLRGHEFRYSTLAQELSRGFEVFDAWGARKKTFGVVEERLFASYVHLHFGSNPQVTQYLIDQVSRV